MVDGAAGGEAVGGDAQAPILLLAVGSSGTRDSTSGILQRVRAAAAGGAPAALEPEPAPPAHAQAQLVGSGPSGSGEQKMLEFQAQRITELEAEKRKLAEEVERLRAAAPTAQAQSLHAEEGVPPVAGSVPARVEIDLGEGAALASRGQKQIAELKDLLQRSLAQLDRPVRHLPLPPAAAAGVVDARHEGVLGERLR